jgi:hypothetical protein
MSFTISATFGMSLSTSAALSGGVSVEGVFGLVAPPT